MNLKCVGGPLDGHTYFVNDDFRYGDQVKLYIRSKRSLMDINPYAIPPESIMEEAAYATYQLTQVSIGSTHKIMFLKDIYMSDIQAFELLIKNHG